MHDRLFIDQQALGIPDLIEHSQALALDTQAFRSCLDGGTMRGRVQRDLSEAQRLGLTSTPVFLIGTLGEKGTVRVTHKIVGAQPFPVFQDAVRRVP
jgi:predicted DsbA family dithiol-disulfide isomerase